MTLHDHSTSDPDAGRDKPVKIMAAVVAAVFVLVGVLGFVPGVTTGYDDMTFADHHSRAELLGVFQVSVLHNVVHLLFGVIGLALARKASTAVAYLVGGGLVYLVLFVYGVAVDHDSSANFVPVNDADNVLHLGLAIGMVALGLVGRTVWRGSVANRTAM
jgi:ABC-type transport system involved in multi-copper enzyme maturation permease subunit